METKNEHHIRCNPILNALPERKQDLSQVPRPTMEVGREPDWHDLRLIATFTSAIGKCNLVTVTAASTLKDLVAMSNSPEKPPP